MDVMNMIKSLYIRLVSYTVFSLLNRTKIVKVDPSVRLKSLTSSRSAEGIHMFITEDPILSISEFNTKPHHSRHLILKFFDIKEMSKPVWFSYEITSVSIFLLGIFPIITNIGNAFKWNTDTSVNELFSQYMDKRFIKAGFGDEV